MKYVLFFCGTAQDQREWEALSDEAREKRYAKVGGWFQEHAAQIGGSHQLQPPHTATTVRFAGAGKPLVTDGPYIEGNEIIGGYAEIEVEDLDEALAMAKEWPGGAAVEVRPVVERF